MLKASCLCPTFNRPPHRQWLIEEAVESFLRQDYPNKELIILNDCAAQTLLCDAPNVFAVNLPRRAASLGEKRNALAALASGDVMFPWDDDDISLPNRISSSIAALGERYDYYNPRFQWQLDHTGLRTDHRVGVGHNGSAYRRALFDRVRGYPHRNMGEDEEIDQEMRRQGTAVPFDSAFGPTHWFYIYRWGVSDTHISGLGQITDDEASYRLIGERTVTPGVYELTPRWQLPYDELTRELAASGAAMMPLERPDLVSAFQVSITR